MAIVDLRRENARAVRELDRRVESAVKQARSRPAPAKPLPLPETLDEWLSEYVWWPHIDRPWERVRGISPIQQEFLASRSALRWNAAGARLAGSDIVAKPRRVQMTSLVLGSILYVCMRWREMRCLTVMQVGRDDILEPIHGQIAHAVRNLPDQWRAKWRRRGGAWEYVHDVSATGDRRNDIVSVWEPVSAGSGEDIADKVGRSRRIDLLHLSEASYYPYPAVLWRACRHAVPNESGWIVVESTLAADPDSWMTRQYYEAAEGRGEILRAHFWPWHRDPLKRISSEREEYSRASALQVSPEDRAQEVALELDQEQVAYRRWYRCQGGPDELWAAARELPETVEEAAERPQKVWLDRGSIQRQRERQRPPLLRARLGDMASVNIWDGEPEACVFGLYRCPSRGPEYAAVVGIHPVSLHQVCEIHGRAGDAELVRGLSLVLAELGLLRTRNYRLVIGKPKCLGLIDLLVRAQREIQVDTPTPIVGEWSRLHGTVKLAWDHRSALWRPRRAGDGGEAGAVGWLTTGYSRSTLMDRLRAAASDADSLLALYSEYLIDELGGLVLGKLDEVEGRPNNDLSTALALALLGVADGAPKAPTAKRWLELMAADDPLSSGGGEPPMPS